MTLHRTDSRIGATVLAALRYWQRGALEGPTQLHCLGEYEIATSAGEVEPLTAEEVDSLCESLNCTGAVYLPEGPDPAAALREALRVAFGETLPDTVTEALDALTAAPPAPTVYVVKGCDRYGPTQRWLAFNDRAAADAQALAWVREMDTEGAGLAGETWQEALRLLNVAQVADAMMIEPSEVSEADLESYREERDSVSEVWIEEVPAGELAPAEPEAWPIFEVDGCGTWSNLDQRAAQAQGWELNEFTNNGQICIVADEDADPPRFATMEPNISAHNHVEEVARTGAGAPGYADLCRRALAICEATVPLPCFAVELIAEGVQVTAEDEQEARKHAGEDARQFMADWTYKLASVEASDDEPADDAAEVVVELGDPEVTPPDPLPTPGPVQEESLWTFAPRFGVVVEAADRPAAVAEALRLLGVAEPEAAGAVLWVNFPEQAEARERILTAQPPAADIGPALNEAMGGSPAPASAAVREDLHAAAVAREGVAPGVEDPALIECIEGAGFNHERIDKLGNEVMAMSGNHWRVVVSNYTGSGLPTAEDWAINVYSVAHPHDEPMASMDCRGGSVIEEAFETAQSWVIAGPEGLRLQVEDTDAQRMRYLIDDGRRHAEEAGRLYSLHQVDNVEQLGDVVGQLIQAVGCHQAALDRLAKAQG